MHFRCIVILGRILCKIIVPFKTTVLNMLSKVGRCHLIATVDALLPNLRIAVHKI